MENYIDSKIVCNITLCALVGGTLTGHGSQPDCRTGFLGGENKTKMRWQLKCRISAHSVQKK